LKTLASPNWKLWVEDSSRRVAMISTHALVKCTIFFNNKIFLQIIQLLFQIHNLWKNVFLQFYVFFQTYIISTKLVVFIFFQYNNIKSIPFLKCILKVIKRSTWQKHLSFFPSLISTFSKNTNIHPLNNFTLKQVHGPIDYWKDHLNIPSTLTFLP
jgi:hypothetical protein